MARRILITVSGEQEDTLAAHIIRESCAVLDADGVVSSVECVKERGKEIEIPDFMSERRCVKEMEKRAEKRRKKRVRRWKSA